MVLEFKLWLESDEDYYWYNAAQAATNSVKNVLQPLPYAQDAKTKAQQELLRNDSELTQGLTTDKLNILLNWLALTIISRGYQGSQPDAVVRKLGRYNPQGTYLPSAEWDKVKDVFHANINTPNFWKSLTKATSNGRPAVTFDYLKRDSITLATQAQQKIKGNSNRLSGPQGRTLIEFPDGWKWISLDRSYCDQEGKSGSHCGNIVGKQRKDDQIVSLRNPQNQVEATFIVNNHSLGESKGYANQKLNPELHPYVAALLLAQGPAPLPITHCLKTLGDYKPESDTKAIDLIYSPNVDNRTKEFLKQKFAHEFNDTKSVSDYMALPVSDQRRREIVALTPWDDQEKEKMMADAKEKGEMARLAEIYIFTISQDEFANSNSDQDFESISQKLSWNIDQLKLATNNRWMKISELPEFETHIDDLLSSIHQALIGDAPRWMNTTYYNYFTDPHVSNREGIIARDKPRRREIGKLFKRFGKLALQLSQEILQNLKQLNFKEPEAIADLAKDCIQIVSGTSTSDSE